MAENTESSVSSKRAAKPPQRVRMIDIAHRAGVSRAAVSHVLNGSPNSTIAVSEKTAERIRRVAEEAKYYPNNAALQLAGKRSGLLAALASSWLTFPVRPRIQSYLSHGADLRGFKILTWQSHFEVARVAQTLPEVLSRKVDALIYVAFENDVEWPGVAPLLSQFPFVVSLLGDPRVAGGSVVLSEPAEGVRQAVRYLHGAGRRKIIQVVGAEFVNSELNRGRKRGLLDAHREVGLPIDPERAWVVAHGLWQDSTSPGPIAACDEVISQGADAVLADDDFFAALLIRALGERGLRVPQDVAVVGWGNETVSRYVVPSLTTVDYRLPEIVEAGLETITAAQDQDGKFQPRSIVIPPKLIVRESA
jgi:DNA-binding LacI/PurR family transcriptional regulator